MRFGTSITLIQVDKFEVSLDVSDTIELTVGTGFGTEGPSVNVEIPLTIEQLNEMVKNLQEIQVQLATANRCTVCSQLMPAELNQCPNCDEYQK